MYVVNVLTFRIIIITSHVIKDNWPKQCVLCGAFRPDFSWQWVASESWLIAITRADHIYIHLFNAYEEKRLGCVTKPSTN